MKLTHLSSQIHFCFVVARILLYFSLGLIKQISRYGGAFIAYMDLCTHDDDRVVILQNSEIGIHIVNVVIDARVCDNAVVAVDPKDWYKRYTFS